MSADRIVEAVALGIAWREWRHQLGGAEMTLLSARQTWSVWTSAEDRAEFLGEAREVVAALGLDKPHANETSTGGFLPRERIPGETYRDSGEA